MATSNTATFNRYIGNGSSRYFSIGFHYENASEVKVYLKRADSEEEEILTADDYGFYESNVIEFPLSSSTQTILDDGDVLVIQRETPLGSDYEFDNNRRLFPSETMGADDLSFRQIQELARNIGRCAQVNATSDIDVKEITKHIEDIHKIAPHIEALYDIKEDVTTVSENIDDVVTVSENIDFVKGAMDAAESAAESAEAAADSADAAADSADAAAASETNAKDSEDNAEIWAEGTDEEVEALGGTHSAKTWSDMYSHVLVSNTEPVDESVDVWVIPDGTATPVGSSLSIVNKVVSLKDQEGTVMSSITLPDGLVDDVKVNNVSVVTNKVANVTVPTKISDLTDDTATNPIDKADTLTNLTATVTELNYVDGVTSNIQTQLDSKQATIDSSNKLSSDLVDDTDHTNKFVTASEKTTWNGKQDALSEGTGIDITNNTISATKGEWEWIGSATDTIALGNDASSTDNYAISLGKGAIARSYCIAIGNGANTLSTGSIAIGSNAGTGVASAQGASSIAIGSKAVTKEQANHGVAIVGTAKSSQEYGIAIGFGSEANTEGSSATQRAYDKGIAIGYNAKSRGGSSIAIGANAVTATSVNYATALGFNAQANATNAMQLGDGINSTPNTLKFKSYQLLTAAGYIPPERLASGGIDGQVLSKTASGMTWVNQSGGGSGSALVPALSNVMTKQNSNGVCYNVNDRDYYGEYQYITFTTNMDNATIYDKMNDLYICIGRSKRQLQRSTTDTEQGYIRKMVIQNDIRYKLAAPLYCWRERISGTDFYDPRAHKYFYTDTFYATVADLFNDDPTVYLYCGEDFRSSKASCLNILDCDMNGYSASNFTQANVERYTQGDIDTFAPVTGYENYVDRMYCKEATKDGQRYFLWCKDWSNSSLPAYGTNIAENIPDHFYNSVAIITKEDYSIGNERKDLDYFVIKAGKTMYEFVEHLYGQSMGSNYYPLEDNHFHSSCYPFDYPLTPVRLADCEVFEHRNGGFVKLKSLTKVNFTTLFKQAIFRYPLNTSELWMRFSSWQKRCMYEITTEQTDYDMSYKNSWKYAVAGTPKNYAFRFRSFGIQRNGYRNYENNDAKITEYIEFNLLSPNDVVHSLNSKATPIQKRLVSVGSGDNGSSTLMD